MGPACPDCTPLLLCVECARLRAEVNAERDADWWTP